MSRLNPNSDEFESRKVFASNVEIFLSQLADRHLPQGSGFDNGTKIDIDRSISADQVDGRKYRKERLVFTTSFHHMNEWGEYDGWTDHDVFIHPSFKGFEVSVRGRNRNDIKTYVAEDFDRCLSVVVDRDGNEIQEKTVENTVSV
ncbi:hypothetical protein [Chroococcidiopsis sp.]|uniref:hypothetical protein n=1 Tax=Chroococcidiopsis sp. TaxID=3088168 RepID=UPI003F36EBA5